eukprot:5925127-Prymnesium_polylepis.1
MLRCIPCVTTVGMVGQSFTSAAHRVAVAASMGALHSMRARAASSTHQAVVGCTACRVCLAWFYVVPRAEVVDAKISPSVR